MALAFAPELKELEVVKINADDKTNRHLNDLGLVVGSKLTLLDCAGGNCIIRFKQCKLALNKSLAMKIIVA